MPSEERSEGSLTDRPIQDLLDAELAVRDLIYVTNSGEFRDRMLHIISVAENLPPRDRQLLWRRLIVSIGERAVGVGFMQRLAPIATDIGSQAKAIKTLDGKSLWEDMLYAAIPVRDSSGFKAISNYLATLPESDYKLDVGIALLSRKLTESPANSLGEFSSIENPTVRRGVEAAALRNLTNSDRAAAFQYFLSDQCLSYDNLGVVSRVAFDILRYEPETASAMLKDAGPGPQKDAAITALVRAFSGSDPDAAFRWAHEIQNVELKTSTLAAIEKQRR